MRRAELGAGILAALIVTALVVLDIWAKHWLAGSEAFNTGSNLIQYSSGPALFVAIGMAAWTRWHRTCKVPYCLRLGEHKVAGTQWKLCSHHHTRDMAWHWWAAEKHRLEQPERAAHGATHVNGDAP